VSAFSRWLIVVVSLLFWATPARAESITIHVESAQRFSVTAPTTLNKATCAVDPELAQQCAKCLDAKDCKSPSTEECTASARAFHISKTDLLKNIVVEPSAEESGERAWLRTLMTSEKVSCVQPGKEAADVDVAIEAGKTLRLEGGVGPNARLPGVLVWDGWEPAHFARVAAKVFSITPQSCKISPAQGNAEVSCSLTQVPQDGGVRLLFTYSGRALEAGLITVTLGTGANAVKLEATIFACDFQVTGRMAPALFADAMLQRIELASPNAECTSRLARATFRMVNGGVTIAASGLQLIPGGGATIELGKVPATVPSGTWRLETTAGAQLGSASFPIIEKPIEIAVDASGNPQLDIHYAVDGIQTDLDQWQDGRSVDGLAVVTAARGDYEQFIQNKTTLKVAPELRNLAKRLIQKTWQPEGAKPVAEPDKCDDTPRTTCDDLETVMDLCGAHAVNGASLEKLQECRSRRRAWRVTSDTWQSDAWVHEDGWWYKAPTPLRSEELSEVTFAAFSPQLQPYKVTVELVDRSAEAERAGVPSETVIFRTQLQLARGARYESLPLPLARALYVECGVAGRSSGPTPTTSATLDVVTNGHTRAVNDDDVTTGNCRLVYSHRLALRALRLKESEQSIDILKYYGRQELTLSVRRGQAEQQAVWSLDPTADDQVRLPIPADAKNAIGIYTVVASLRGRLPPPVTYRSGAATAQGNANPALGDLEFKANLRPRGPFGWKAAPIRAFMTFPINFTGLRFPARPEELKSSSSSPTAQVTPLQVGVLFAVEPWNYDTGRNAWPVPTRFVTGAHLYNLSDGEVSPSWVTGVSVTLPIFDLQKGVAEDQLGTDVALGLFWEVDIAEKDWITHGHHGLITLGLNVLSLFGSK
jgi:hypothetical protein